jgi:hypothetical protein
MFTTTTLIVSCGDCDDSSNGPHHSYVNWSIWRQFNSLEKNHLDRKEVSDEFITKTKFISSMVEARSETERLFVPIYALTLTSFICPLVQFSGPPKCDRTISFDFDSGNFSVDI